MATITANSGHTLFIQKVLERDTDLPKDITEKYTNFYVVKNWDKDGVKFFTLCKGWKGGTAKGSREIHVYYRSGKIWSGFGTNFQSAIDGAQKDGWMYAE